MAIPYPKAKNMSLATAMKGLVEDIQTSTTARHHFAKDIVKDVEALLTRFNKEQKDTIGELKEMSAEVKKFLIHGEKARKEGFAVLTKDITERLGEISRWQKDARKDARGLVKEYASDHKKAREHWLSLGEHRRKPGHPKKEEKE